MQDPRLLYTIDPVVRESLRELTPVLVHLCDGYMDAGAAGRTVAETMLAELEHEVLVEFDVDQLHDYRSRRPTATFDTDTWTGVQDFVLRIEVVTDLSGHRFLLLHGPEPDTQWNRFIAAVLEVCRELGVETLLTGHGVPVAVPHTRPTLITTHATDRSLATGNPSWIDRIDVPAGISGVLEYRAGEAGLTAIGFVAHVPHYLAQSTFHQAAVAIMRRFAERAALDLPAGVLEELVSTNNASIDAEVMADNDLPALVHALEEQYEKVARVPSENLPSADEIGAAVEAYLAEQEKPQDPGDAAFGS
jgi:hypothetical protein